MIERRAFSGAFSEGQAAGYTRQFVNYTGKTIVVVDGSGMRTRIRPLAPHPQGILAGQFIVAEFYEEGNKECVKARGIRYEDNTSYRFQNHSRSAGQSTENLHIRHSMLLADLLSTTEGIYDETLGLWIGVEGVHLDVGVHPVENNDLKQSMDRNGAMGIMVEILDPHARIPNFYLNLGGDVEQIKPVRYPTPEQEGVRITHRDSATGEFTVKHYTLEELTTGQGKHGVRLYETQHGAAHDGRNPDTQKFNEEKRKFYEERAQHDRRIREEERLRYEAQLREALEKERKQNEERTRKMEDELNKRHKEKVKDRTTLLAAILKGAMLLAEAARWGWKFFKKET